MHNTKNLYLCTYKVHSFSKQCFARFLLDTIGGTLRFQGMTSRQISCREKSHKIKVSSIKIRLETYITHVLRTILITSIFSLSKINS